MHTHRERFYNIFLTILLIKPIMNKDIEDLSDTINQIYLLTL